MKLKVADTSGNLETLEFGGDGWRVVEDGEAATILHDGGLEYYFNEAGYYTGAGLAQNAE